MRHTHVIVVGLIAALVVAAACSDTNEPIGNQDAEIKYDVGPLEDTIAADTLVEDTAPAADAGEHNIGEGCKGQSDCKSGSSLCIGVLSSDLMICSRSCTPDDSNTPLINEDDCPDGFLCGSFRFTSATYNYCLKKCKPSQTKNPCSPSSKTTCDPVSTRYGDLKQAVCYEPACKDGKSCPVLSGKTCSIDADCSAVGTDAYCDTKNGFLCARPGTCTPGGLCGKHTYGKSTAKVGDTCTSDFDCPNNGRCWRASTDSSSIGIHYNNGYCVIDGCAFSTDVPDYACPAGSSCFQMFYGGLCHKSCTLATAADCRGHASDKGGDYECYAWQNLSFGGVGASTTPICTSAAGQTCDFFAASSLDCSSIGEKGNPTSMSCRDRFTGKKKTNAADPTGVCLDDTASGTFQTAADAGVPDSSPVVDAGSTDSAPAADAGTVEAGAVDSAPAVDSAGAVDAATPDAAPAVDAASVD